MSSVGELLVELDGDVSPENLHSNCTNSLELVNTKRKKIPGLFDELGDLSIFRFFLTFSQVI
jgi:hypothetical protein